MTRPTIMLLLHVFAEPFPSTEQSDALVRAVALQIWEGYI
jgi:hypothetical protein